MNNTSMPVVNTKPILIKTRIRMFRQGLGDCFLLTFTNADQKEYNLLIDCGVLPISGGEKRLEASAKQILSECHGFIDAVVATHEHADHISGFSDQFFSLVSVDQPAKSAKIGQVWLAWTENNEDDQVKKILEKVDALSLAVNSAAMCLGEDQGQFIRDLLLFGGYQFEGGDLIGTTDKKDNKEGGKFQVKASLRKNMDFLRQWAPSLKYLEQTDLIELPEFGIKIYPLGPSRDINMLGGQQPEQRLRLNMSTAFIAAAYRFAGLKIEANSEANISQGDLDDLFNQSLPFNQSVSIKIEEIKKNTPMGDGGKYRRFYKKVYGYNKKGEGHGPEWRRIDTDWLQIGANLALQQVSIVNNTSLVLAIELTESGKVLLFAADAERENWKTWRNDHADLRDLLARTVVYKMGHHGSINATDPEVFTKNMTNIELVALIPTDVARATIKKWRFPDPSLYNFNALIETEKGLLFKQTKGRVILNCVDECKDCTANYDPDKPWPGRVEEDPSPQKMWVDYVLEF